MREVFSQNCVMRAVLSLLVYYLYCVRCAAIYERYPRWLRCFRLRTFCHCCYSSLSCDIYATLCLLT